MSKYNWKNDFCTGIDNLDEHHRKFFEYLKQLEEAAGGSKGREVVERGLKMVDDYILFHFAEEEKLLKATGYPGLEQQKREHEFFASQIAELKERFFKGDPHIPISTLEFLRDWFLHHILESDKKYGTYLSEDDGRMEIIPSTNGKY